MPNIFDIDYMYSYTAQIRNKITFVYQYLIQNVLIFRNSDVYYLLVLSLWLPLTTIYV